jgi:rhamnulose-1-phosphate aldolase/alcohol dehydrogenase
MSTLPRVSATVEDRWPASTSAGSSGTGPLAQLMLASHLLGADRAVANYGGGNTSAKGTDVDHTDCELNVMWVKGSGSDLATISERDFVRLRLDQIVPLFERQRMSDGEMVDHLTRCQLDPSAPRPSIETLLHAFIPATHVHHTHPDAINALAGARDGERLLNECFGAHAAWVPYVRPGFRLAQQVGALVRGNGELRLVVLAKHGLVAWGETAEEAYRKTIEVTNRAAEFVNARSGGERFGGPSATAGRLSEVERGALLRAVLPAARGAVSSERAKVLVVDESEAALQFVDSCEAPALVEVGAACPDHLVHTKRVPLWVPFDPETDDAASLGARVVELADRFRADYAAYFERNADGSDERADPNPRVIAVEHLGVVGAGTSRQSAQLSRDLYRRAIEVMGGAQAVGGFVSLSEQESFGVEYWPLELYKLSLVPPPGELEGKVAVVTGAAGGIGRAVVDKLSSAGACVVAFDIDGDGAVAAVAELGDSGIAVQGDVRTEDGVASAFAVAIETFGGVDIVVSNAGLASSAPIEETSLGEWERIQSVLMTGYFLVARSAMSVLREQGRGGSIVVIASKNALSAGRNNVAYSAAKAGELHLARCLAEEGGVYGVRVNTVNPDAVIEGSRIWSSSWREDRAAAYGISPEELNDYYRERTTLGVNIVPDDVAEAVLHFASDARSGKSTGNILNVDGGVAAAYPR